MRITALLRLVARLLRQDPPDMPGARKLVVGLGNPGPKYERTRHNVGFVVADALAERHGITLKHHKGVALAGWGVVGAARLGIVKPTTFMNRSGQAVRDVARYYDVAPEEMLVVFDDLNLPLGKIRLRLGGSAGGHNGVQDVIDALGTDAFARLRIGIGGEFARGRQADYVLSPFSAAEREVVDGALVEAREAAEMFVLQGIETAMNRHN